MQVVAMLRQPLLQLLSLEKSPRPEGLPHRQRVARHLFAASLASRASSKEPKTDLDSELKTISSLTK